MPVSHISLTVSHLPSSCTFFLAALSPLGYRYIGQEDNKIGFGLDQADFFICQQSQGTPPGPAHVAFSAPSHSAVDSFFRSALRAGGEIFGEPTVREPKTGYYSAGVLDLDRNSIEVVYRPVDSLEEGMALTRISESPSENRMMVRSQEYARSAASQSAVSQSLSTERSPLRTIVNNLTTPIRVIQQEQIPNNDSVSKTLIGTLIGAAAGAAIAYAISKTEPDVNSRQSVERDREVVYHAIDAPSSAYRVERSPRSYYPSSPPSNAPTYHSQQSHRSSSYQRAIEPHHSPSSPGTVNKSSREVVQYLSPPSQHPHSSFARSQSDYLSPDRIPLPRSPSVRSVVSSGARTVTQADFPPASPGHRSGKISVASHHEDSIRPSPRSSRHSSYQGAPASPSGPIVEEVEDIDLDGSVSPSDSISQAGSNKSRHRHKSRHSGRSRSQRRESGKRSVVSLPAREVGEERRGLGRRSVVSQILGR
ncbi:hypothetical protein MMC17_005175 [Xylographa soralifera]|nr:hypothetical protein [Xylographa soralifera]